MRDSLYCAAGSWALAMAYRSVFIGKRFYVKNNTIVYVAIPTILQTFVFYFFVQNGDYFFKVIKRLKMSKKLLLFIEKCYFLLQHLKNSTEVFLPGDKVRHVLSSSQLRAKWSHKLLSCMSNPHFIVELFFMTNLVNCSSPRLWE